MWDDIGKVALDSNIHFLIAAACYPDYDIIKSSGMCFKTLTETDNFEDGVGQCNKYAASYVVPTTAEKGEKMVAYARNYATTNNLVSLLQTTESVDMS